MFSEALVKMNEMLKRLGEDPLNGQVLFTRLEFPSIIVLEDLAASGYRMANRITGLDLLHAELAIRNIARFHASSIAYLQNVIYHNITVKIARVFSNNFFFFLILNVGKMRRVNVQMPKVLRYYW